MFFKHIGKFALGLPLAGIALSLAASGSALACEKHAAEHHMEHNASQQSSADATTHHMQTVTTANADHSLTVQGAWARAMFPTAKVGAGYFQIMNDGDTAIRLVSVKSDVSKAVEIHSMEMEDNVMKMRHLNDGIDIAAHSGLSFKPGSYHLMFMDPKSPFKADETFNAEFTFSNGEVLKVPFIVRQNNNMSSHEHHAH